jgi:hypothetical protein
MRARHLDHCGWIEEGRHSVSFQLVAVLGLLICTCGATAQTSSAPRQVRAAEQAARDSERVEILRQELKKSEALLEALERRKIQPRAAADVESASEAEEQRGRTLSDIAGLKRELAAATRAAAAPQGNAEVAVTPKPAPIALPSRPAKTPPAAPWWDVYGKVRLMETPAAASSAVSIAPAEAGPRNVSARRPE